MHDSCFNKMDEFDLYQSGCSMPEISKKLGMALSTIRYRLNKAGILRSRKDGIRLASKRGRLGSGNRGKKVVFSEEHKKNISKAKKGVGRGYRLNGNGYYEYTMGEHKGRHIHVVKMEKLIGRRIHRNECVHHKDKNKTNNSVENLELMTLSEHAKLHAKENYKNRKIDKKGRLT